jgi:glycosyltransferase involved in cell wall biosynthesis
VVRFCDKALLRQFDGVVMVSEATRRLVPKWWLPDSKVAIIHNALAIESYGKWYPDLGSRRTETSDRVVILNVGRLSPEKGQDLLLQAFSLVAGAYPSIQLWFAGTGSRESALQRLAEALGLSERVRFLGYVADMPSVYREADVVVQSSLTEGLPNVILESLYLQIPTIATAVGGTNEIIDHGISGWLVRSGSVNDLADALRAFLEDPERFAVMAANGKEQIESRFSFAARTQKVTKLYEDLQRRRRRGAF